MLKRTRPLPERWRHELENMLRTRRKAEIEVLAAASGPADLNLDGEVLRGSQGRIHPLMRYLSEKIAARVAALNDVHMKIEED